MHLKHLHLHVRDRERSEQFYGDWFEMRLARRGARLSFLSDDAGFDLALMDDPAPPGMPSWFHFGFRLETADAVTSLLDRMTAAQVPVLKPLYRDETLASFRCADPDGYPIEIYWEAADAPLD